MNETSTRLHSKEIAGVINTLEIRRSQFVEFLQNQLSYFISEEIGIPAWVLLGAMCDLSSRYLASEVLSHGHKPFLLSTQDPVCRDGQAGHTILGMQNPITGEVAAYDPTPQQTTPFSRVPLKNGVLFGPFFQYAELKSTISTAFPTPSALPSTWQVSAEVTPLSIAGLSQMSDIIRAQLEQNIDCWKQNLH